MPVDVRPASRGLSPRVSIQSLMIQFPQVCSASIHYIVHPVLHLTCIIYYCHPFFSKTKYVCQPVITHSACVWSNQSQRRLTFCNKFCFCDFHNYAVLPCPFDCQCFSTTIYLKFWYPSFASLGNDPNFTSTWKLLKSENARPENIKLCLQAN